MVSDSPIDAAWPELLSRLPASLDLAATARASGALVRRRKVKSAADLLRVVLGYGARGLSLRATALWAGLQKIAPITNVTVLNRVRQAGPWLGQIMAAILSARLRSRPAQAVGARLCLIDATVLSAPGSKGVDWRVHADYDVQQQRLRHVEVSDAHGAEGLRRFALGPGDIAIADRVYARGVDLAAVTQAGADFIVRIGWNALRLRDRAGGTFDLFGMLAGLREGERRELAVTIALDRSERTLLPVRLVALRKSAAQAASSRRRARAHARKQGRAIQNNTVRAADYVLLLTSLPSKRASAKVVLDLYRMRWQVELAFKRLKSLLRLGDLPAKDPELARSWIYAKLIAALLIEDQAHQVLDSFPSAGRTSGLRGVALAPAAIAA